MARIYMSSTHEDLVAFREPVFRELRKNGHTVVASGGRAATEELPLDQLLAEVDACDLYVGIVAWRYGYVPARGNPEGLSVVEAEYRRAGRAGRPCLLFLLDDEAPWSPRLMDSVTGEGVGGERIRAFRKLLIEEHPVSRFKTPDELASLVAIAVHNWQQSTFRDTSVQRPAQEPRRLPLIEVASADLRRYPADVVVLKSADRPYGVDAVFIELLREARALDWVDLGQDEYRLVATSGAVSAPRVLFMGIGPLYEFRYERIRGMAARSLAALAKEAPEVVHAASPIHGPGFGLDESEAFLSQVAGYFDGIRSGVFPPRLARITIVELDRGRADRLSRLLQEVLSRGTRDPAAAQEGIMVGAPRPVIGRGDALSVPSEQKPHAFVAMPYRDELEDVWHFGISQPVNRCGYLCERMDLQSFLGDVMAKMRERIESAAVIIGDLSGANPNVYFEIGYAFGRGQPTILVARSGEQLPFDVRGVRCLIYKSAKNLADMLEPEIEALQRGRTLPPGDPSITRGGR